MHGGNGDQAPAPNKDCIVMPGPNTIGIWGTSVPMHAHHAAILGDPFLTMMFSGLCGLLLPLIVEVDCGCSRWPLEIGSCTLLGVRRR